MSKPVDIHVVSGLGYRTQQPFVSLRVRDVAVQMSPADARTVGHWLLEAAEGAESDAFVAGLAKSFVSDEGGDAERIVGGLLLEFREFREQERVRMGKEPR